MNAKGHPEDVIFTGSTTRGATHIECCGGCPYESSKIAIVTKRQIHQKWVIVELYVIVEFDLL